jgi:hypothetical protein
VGAAARRPPQPRPARRAARLARPAEARRRAHGARGGEVGPARARILRERALRTISQGHLAQHLFFHSLHQFGIASEAPAIFGVTDVEFRRLRRAELSPLAIARLHGRSPGQVEALAIAVLRERAQTGVRGHAIPPAQADRLLRRQLSQLPRWLDQARYNGPPTTYRGALEAVPHDYASNPAISADGRHVAYESYRQKLPLAIKFGEIAVLRADLSTGKTAIVSRLPHRGPTGPDPISAYNATASEDGSRIAFESSRGNQNFAKRYGRIGVLLADGERTRGLDKRNSDIPDSQSAYNPAMSADGSRVAYQAVRDGRTVVLVSDARGRTRTVVRGAGVGGATFADPYEPALSADGSKLVYTLATGRADDPGRATSQVLVRDVATGRTTVASRTTEGAIGDGFSADPAISPDGRFVAFTSDAPNLGAARGRAGLFVRDLRDGRTRQVPTGTARVLDPGRLPQRAGRRVHRDAGRHGTDRRLDAAHRGGVADHPRQRLVRGRLDLRRRPAHRLRLGGDEPRLAADGRQPRDLRPRPSREDDPRRERHDRRLPQGRAQAARRQARAGSRACGGARQRAGRRRARHRQRVRAPRRPADRDARRRQPADLGLPLAPVARDHGARRAGAVRAACAQQRSLQPRLRPAGTYEIVCALHAPGMRMTVVVR